MTLLHFGAAPAGTGWSRNRRRFPMFGSSLRACLIGLVAVVAVSASPGFARAAGNRIDSGGVVGRMSSITIGSDDLVLQW
jgi:hypothetical protein